LKFDFVDRIAPEHFDDLVQLYHEVWWGKERRPEDVRKMLKHTDLVFGFVESQSGRLAAFARVLTDHTYRATLYDVIVATAYRKMGLGARLLDAVVNHSELKTLERLELSCLPPLVGFYQRWQFSDELGDVRFMRRKNVR
jgi:predicted GNAT family N-acyltransferase